MTNPTHDLGEKIVGERFAGGILCNAHRTEGEGEPIWESEAKGKNLACAVCEKPL